MSGAMQEQSLNAMREQQLMGAERERGNIRRLVSSPDFDISSPDAPNRLLAVAPTTGAAAYQALTAGLNQRRQAQVADLDRAAKLTEWWMDRLGSATPENYAAMRAAAVRDVPNWEYAWPAQYSPDAVRRLQSNAAESLLRYRTTITASPAGGFVESPQARPYGTEPLEGPRYIPPESIPAVPPNAPTAPPAAPRAEGPAIAIPAAAPEGGPRAGTRPGMTPGQIAAANFLRGAEDYREAPYFDVTAYRAGYGSDTTTLADGRVVPVRQGMTVSREDAERDLARRIPEFTQRAAANIGRDRFEALPPNAQAALISIAYNYGHIPESIRASARSGDLAALSRDVAALPANPSRRRQEAAMIAGGAAPNAMAAPGATTNAMLAPPDATAVQRPLGIPEFPGLPRAANLSDADLIKRIRDIQSKEAEARMQEDLRRETEAARIQEEGRKAEAIARAQADVRGDKPPPPAGQRYTPDGRLEDIPGSPQARAQTERRAGQVAAANVVTRDIDRVLERLDTAVLPVTGFGATTMAALVGGSPAADVKRLRDSLEANIAFNKLNELRQQSPTGGALGNVTDKDMELLKAVVGSLSQDQSPRQFRENLINVRNEFMRVIHGENWREVAPPPREPPPPERLPGQRGAPRPANRPTLEQFLERARPANPNASIEDLTSYYNRTYGGR
jgi:GH24 family phage-related lysozyme (muramidase)